eukprot:1141358-Pelagomonas_calceolata.AAC.4
MLLRTAGLEQAWNKVDKGHYIGQRRPTSVPTSSGVYPDGSAFLTCGREANHSDVTETIRGREVVGRVRRRSMSEQVVVRLWRALVSERACSAMH